MVQKAFDRTVRVAIFITSVVLLGSAIVGGGLSAPNVATTDLSLVSVIHKNQQRPSIAELEAHAGSKNEAKGDEGGLITERQGQWI